MKILLKSSHPWAPISQEFPYLKSIMKKLRSLYKVLSTNQPRPSKIDGLMTTFAPLWRQIQRLNFTNLDSLADFLELSEKERELLLDRPRFVLNLPLRLAEKI